MSAVPWDRLVDIFESAGALAEGDRAGFLDRACAGDGSLRAEVEAMLETARPDGALSIERLVVETRPPEVDGDPWIGRTLGPWRLTRRIGHGGMGLVYGALRADGSYRQEVAVKLMRPASRDPYAAERFRTERQVLASLKHPNIAALLDGGFADDGTPFLVMELVDGFPLTDWCRSGGLSLGARLDLFRVVCDAVQHAHRALVVHRDLKPSNILVSSGGDVKLLDFGIAKLLEPEAFGVESSATETGMRALTPDYAAPEQRHGGRVTTATDVYGLGVVLYELVAGVRPRAEGQGGEPTTLTPPSEAVRRGLGAGEGTREPERKRRSRRIRGDLDRIVLTALRDEPERRYGSAGQLGEELGRFLDGRPVLAQPDTFGYRLRKFVGRNRVAVAAASVFVTSLATFGSISAWQARVLAQQRRVAQRERDASEQVTRVLIDLFETTNPSVRPDGDRMPVGEFLRGSQARALALLRDQPGVRASLQHVFGLIHQTRGQYAPARLALEDALAERRRLLGPDAPATLESLQALGEVCHEGGDDVRARALLEESLARHRRMFGERDARTARVLAALAAVESRHDIEKAGELWRRALEIRRAVLPAGHPDVAASLAALGGYFYERGDFAHARDLYREALASLRKTEDGRHPLNIEIRDDLAAVLDLLNAHAEAEALQHEAIAIGREVLGRESATVANLLNNLGGTYAQQGKLAEAERTYRESFEIHRSLFGEEHWRTRNVARNVGRVLEIRGRYAEALEWMDRAIVRPRAGGNSDDVGSWLTRAQRARVLFRVGRRSEAMAEARAAVGFLEGSADVRAGWRLAVARLILGRMLDESDRPREAEPVLAAAFEFTGDGSVRLERAEIACELARARLLQGAGADERRRLGECLSTLRAWPLADRETVAALERLAAHS